MTVEPVIRPATAGDAVVPVVEAAFGAEGPVVRRLWTELAASDGLRGSLVAEVDGTVVGHVGLSHAWLDARRALVDVWLLSPLSVAPGHQGQGLGTRLLAAAVAAARAGGAPLLVLEGDPGFYGPRGFEPAADHGIAAPSPRTPPPAFQVVLLDGHEPWMSGPVVYPDVWWRHDAAGLRDPALAEVEAALGLTADDPAQDPPPQHPPPQDPAPQDPAPQDPAPQDPAPHTPTSAEGDDPQEEPR